MNPTPRLQGGLGRRRGPPGPPGPSGGVSDAYSASQGRPRLAAVQEALRQIERDDGWSPELPAPVADDELVAVAARF